MKRAISSIGCLLLGCHTGPQPCTTPGSCPSDTECLANRCVALGGDPVRPGSQRVVLTPIALSVVNAGAASQATPTAIVFGSERAGASVVYLKFPRAGAAPGSLSAAFLLLDPMPGTARSETPVDVTAYRISKRWQPDEPTRLSRPELGPPSSRARAHAGLLRVDVTDIVRHLIDHPEQDHGLALIAGAGRGSGVSFSTGFGTPGPAPGPRLELYLERR